MMNIQKDHRNSGHSQTNEDEEEPLNDIFQRIDRHGKALLGESVRAGESTKEKSNLNKKVQLSVSKQAGFSVKPNENKKNVFGNNVRTKSVEVSDSHADSTNKRRKLLSGIRSRSETRKKKLSHTRDHSAQASSRPLSPSKFDIRIHGPTRELYKFDVDMSPTHKSKETLQILKKSSVNSVDTEVTQVDNESPRFDGVEVTIRVSENDKKKSAKKSIQRKLLGHESLRLTKPSKFSKTAGSSSSYTSYSDKITPSQQKLLDTIMSHIHKKGLSSSLRQHIQNLLSMSRENVNDLGISSSDTSVDSLYMESTGIKQPVTKENNTMILQQNEVHKAPAKSDDLNPEKEELRIEAARKTADIISQYSQMSEMLVKKIENLAKVGSHFDMSFTPNAVNGTRTVDPTTSVYSATSVAESSYLNLPPHVNPNLPVDRNIMKAFSSGDRYSQLTQTFDELSEPMYFGPPYFIPLQQTEKEISKEIPDERGQLFYYYPNNAAHGVHNVYIPSSNSYFVEPGMRPQYRETDRRSMPPPTLTNGRFRFGIESSSPPHELTTIPEVDTPKTHAYSDSNIFSEQGEMFLDVFEGLNISQSDNDDENETSSESIKSVDSVSSISNIVSMLMQRKIITSPFENRRKRKIMQILQNKESQQNMMHHAGSSNIMSSPYHDHHYVNTSSTAGMTRNATGMMRDHIDFDNMSISPIQYMNYRLETINNVNPFAQHYDNYQVNNLVNSSSFKPAVQNGAFVDNIVHKELLKGDNTMQQDIGLSFVSEQTAANTYKNVHRNNIPEVDTHTEPSSLKTIPLEEKHFDFSDTEGKRLAKFNEILRNLSEAKEITSNSSPEDLQVVFHNLGVAGWAGTTLHKKQKVQNGSSTNKGIRRSDGIKGKNVFSNWKSVEEDIT